MRSCWVAFAIIFTELLFSQPTHPYALRVPTWQIPATPASQAASAAPASSEPTASSTATSDLSTTIQTTATTENVVTEITAPPITTAAPASLALTASTAPTADAFTSTVTTDLPDNDAITNTALPATSEALVSTTDTTWPFDLSTTANTPTVMAPEYGEFNTDALSIQPHRELSPFNLTVTLGSNTTMQVAGGGDIYSCEYRTPTGLAYYFDDYFQFPGVTFPESKNMTVCEISIGPIEEAMLGEWEIVGFFMGNGTATKRRQLFNVIQKAPEDTSAAPMTFSPAVDTTATLDLSTTTLTPTTTEDIYDDDYTDSYFNLIELSPLNLTVTRGSSAIVQVVGDGNLSSCEYRTPTGFTYYFTDYVHFPGVTILDSKNMTVCAIAICPIENILLGEWEIVGRFSSNGHITERRQMFRLIQREAYQYNDEYVPTPAVSPTHRITSVTPTTPGLKPTTNTTTATSLSPDLLPTIPIDYDSTRNINEDIFPVYVWFGIIFIGSTILLVGLLALYKRRKRKNITDKTRFHIA